MKETLLFKPVSIIVVLLFSATCIFTAPEDVDALLFEASDYLNSSEYEEAEAVYRTVLDIYPENPVAQEGLLYALSMQQRYSDILESIRELGLVTTSARLWEAHALYMTADYIGSINAYRNILHRDPKNITALAGLGWNYVDLGYFQYARTFFAKALRENEHFNPAIEGLRFSEQSANLLYAQLSWFDREDINANPSLYLFSGRTNYQAFLLGDFFAKDNLNDANDEDIFTRSILTAAFRYYLSRFVLGTNFYYLTSSEQFMYDAQGVMLLFQSTQPTPFFLIDYGLAIAASRYKFGNTTQAEIYGNIHFNGWSLKPAVVFIELDDQTDYRLVEEPKKIVYSIGADYFFNKDITVRFSGSIGEKMLMMNKNGYVTDKFSNLPDWELDLSISFRREGYLFYLGTKYDENELTSIYGGIGVTIRTVHE